MRRYERYCLVMLFMILCAWFVLPVFLARTQLWFKRLQTADVHTLSTTASNSLVYPVKPKQWLTFALPEDSSQLRILTNAHIRRTAIIPDSNWAYALRYELLNKKGTVLERGLYHQRSHLTTYKDDQGELRYGNYYANKGIVPLDGRLILLNMQAIKNAAFLRVSLETVTPDIIATAVRVYIPGKISKHQVATSWLRMNQKQKDNLAKNSVYPASLLSAEEQNNLIRHQWQAIGPAGIEGEDYQILSLYTLKDKEMELTALTQVAGLQADAQHYAAIPLPEKGGKLALDFKALDGSALTSPVAINLQWFGRNKEQRWQQDAVWSKDQSSLNYHLDGGLLVIRPSAPVIVSAWLTTDTEAEHLMTNASLSIKTYRSKFTVDFEVLHYQQQTTALRIDVRRLLNVATTLQPDTVHYQGLNEQQQVIISGDLTALASPSLFDQVGSITEPDNVSDPVSYYFSLPAQVTRLRLFSDTPELLVAAYNQPYGVTKWQRVPEDAYIDSDKQDVQLTWFPLRAINDKSLMQQQAVLWLKGQHTPPEDSPDVLAGQYLWQDYVPQAYRDAINRVSTSARYLLTDYTAEEARADALASVYCTLAVNQDNRIHFAYLQKLRSVSPELIFLRDNDSPFTAELFINQQKVLARNMIGQQGMIHLPETVLGDQGLRLNTNSDGRWLMNYQAKCVGKQYLKRRVFALNANEVLDFVVQHAAEDEVLSARWYSPLNTVDRSQLKVDIEAITATTPKATLSTNWTYQKRLYDIRPLPGAAMSVLYTQGQSLGNGERFAIPLNSDLPPGDYRIRIALAKGAAGYITLSQIKAGVHEQRRFYRETTFEH